MRLARIAVAAWIALTGLLVMGAIMAMGIGLVWLVMTGGA